MTVLRSSRVGNESVVRKELARLLSDVQYRQDAVRSDRIGTRERVQCATAYGAASACSALSASLRQIDAVALPGSAPWPSLKTT